MEVRVLSSALGRFWPCDRRRACCEAAGISLLRSVTSRVESLRVDGQQTCPLPDDPTLASLAVALRDAGQWAEIVDRDWRCVYMTDDLRLSYGGLAEPVRFALGEHYFGPRAVNARLQWPTGTNKLEFIADTLAGIGGWTLADTAGPDRAP